MKFRQLGNSGLNVSVIGLGTMTFGQQNSLDDGVLQLEYAVGQGINFIDTAEMYPVPPAAETQGSTETIIGAWLKKRGRRDDVLIASKVTGPNPQMDWIRGGPRLTRSHIHAAVEDNLRRLGTEYIDLYQLHWPERSTNFFGKLGYSQPDAEDGVSIEESLEALSDLVTQGKVRHVGISNETPWGVAEFIRLAEARSWPRIVSIQNPYNLLNRSFEVGLAEFAHRNSVPLLAYSPLAMGVLSGKYLDGAKPAGARLTLFPSYTRYNTGPAYEATRAYVDIAQAHGLDPAQMALAYVNSRPFLASNLIGATTMDQLRTNIASIDLELGHDVLAEIEAVHRDISNPSP